jgi:hypothetical protein
MTIAKEDSTVSKTRHQLIDKMLEARISGILLTGMMKRETAGNPELPRTVIANDHRERRPGETVWCFHHQLLVAQRQLPCMV